LNHARLKRWKGCLTILIRTEINDDFLAALKVYLDSRPGLSSAVYL
jgi:hypothetical protein